MTVLPAPVHHDALLVHPGGAPLQVLHCLVPGAAAVLGPVVGEGEHAARPAVSVTADCGDKNIRM